MNTAKIAFFALILLLTSVRAERQYIPEYAKSFIDSVRKNSKEYNGHKFYYDKEENAVLEIRLTNPKDRRKTRVAKTTWLGSTIEGKYKITQKKKDKAEEKIKQRRKDSSFVEIERIVLKTLEGIRYDFLKAKGIEAKYRNPNIELNICDEYANKIIKALENNSLVEKVEKWTSRIGDHAWNVIILKDGRKIYCDATWYQLNKIDNEGYVTEIPEKYAVNLTFDFEEFNNLGGAIETISGNSIKVHFAWADAILVN